MVIVISDFVVIDDFFLVYKYFAGFLLNQICDNHHLWVEMGSAGYFTTSLIKARIWKPKTN